MRPRKLLLPLAAGFALTAPTAASANFLHVVSPGETLTSVAAADGLSLDQLAAANGISPDTQLVAGSTIAIPPQTGATSATTTSTSGGDGDGDADDGVATAAPASGGSYVVQAGDTLSAIAARAGMSTDSLAAVNGLNPDAYLLSGTVLKLSGATTTAAATSAPASGGSYVVQAGDTLSAIAARAGMTVDGLAALNGLDPNAALLSGTVLKLSGGATTSTSASAASQPVGAAAEGSSAGPPYPTPERVSASEVGSIAAANGVPPSLADAIGWQESGFNNDLVSPADARGVMQILPGTWQWINSSLAPAPLSPSSAADNVRGGVLMLHSLLNATGGNEAMAAAGYYQGLPSVEQHGLYSDTQQYVNSVMSLASRFGGG
jgi:N-acetylmuramoyl-L-alanine amidase